MSIKYYKDTFNNIPTLWKKDNKKWYWYNFSDKTWESSTPYSICRLKEISKKDLFIEML